MSDILEDLIEGYDIRLRPKFGGKNCYNDKFTIDHVYISKQSHTYYCGTPKCMHSLHTYILCDVSLLFFEYEPENPFVERTILHLYLPINSYNNIMLLYNVIIFSVGV